MKIIFLICFLSFSLNASLLLKSLITNIELSTKDNNYIDIKKYNFDKDLFQDLSIKLNINKYFLKEDIYYLQIKCDNSSLLFSNVMYKNSDDGIFIKIDKFTLPNLIFTFSYPERKELDLRIFVHNEFTYKYIVKNDHILYGLAYGILFSAFLYNLILFVYSREIVFFYYSFMQITLLVIMIFMISILNKNALSSNIQMFIDLLETSCMLFTILFSREILNVKKLMKSINKLYSFLIYINIVDLIFILIFQESILYEYLPRSLMAIVFVFTGFYSLYKKHKIAIYYILAWVFLFLSLFIAEHELIGLDEIYILHIAFPLESLILSFALGYKLKQNLDKKEENDKILVHQSKLASMGEMINNISHQWRQPLTHLSFINMNISLAYEDNDLSEKYLNDKLNESNTQIEFMSETIDNFRDFYKPKKTKEYFLISSASQKAIDIIKPSLNFYNISISFNIEQDKRIKAFENEYSQVILNLLTNAKDVLVQRQIKDPSIYIDIKIENNRSVLYLYDNAGGIKDEIIEKVFEPYFSTKEKSSGIGLYMSKTIIESHFKGDISVYNNLNGACFMIEL